jgi:hypothetical protein
MHPKPGPSLPCSKALHAASPPDAADPVLKLETELLHALQCAGRLRLRARFAERELRATRRELARRKADAREQLHAMRLELLAMETRCSALEEVCRALVLTIEQAACAEVEPPPLEAGVSP